MENIEYEGKVDFSQVDDRGNGDDFKYTIGGEIFNERYLLDSYKGKKIKLVVQVEDYDCQCSDCDKDLYEEDCYFYKDKSYCYDCYSKKNTDGAWECPECNTDNIASESEIEDDHYVCESCGCHFTKSEIE